MMLILRAELPTSAPCLQTIYFQGGLPITHS